MDFWCRYPIPLKLNILQDTSKVLWSLLHIFRSDARRKFNFGLTIEGGRLRLWYSDRAAIIVSETIDFISVS